MNEENEGVVVVVRSPNPPENKLTSGALHSRASRSRSLWYLSDDIMVTRASGNAQSWTHITVERVKSKLLREALDKLCMLCIRKSSVS